MTSLRQRIFLTLGAVVVVALLVTGVVSWWNLQRQVGKAVIVKIQEPNLPKLDGAEFEALRKALAEAQPQAEIDAKLAQLLSKTNFRGVLFDKTRTLTAVWPLGVLTPIEARMADDHSIALIMPTTDGKKSTLRLREPTHVFYDEAEQAVGYLYLAQADLRSPESYFTPRPRQELADQIIAAVTTWQIVSILAIGLLALFVLDRLSRRLLRPVEDLTAAVKDIADGNLARQVDHQGRDEIAALATAFNAMAQNLAEQERLRQQMVCDIAHELRTPVTNIRCQLEAVRDGLMQADDALVSSILEEVISQSALIEELQELSLAEAGTLSLHPEIFDLNEAVDGICQKRRVQMTSSFLP